MQWADSSDSESEWGSPSSRKKRAHTWVEHSFTVAPPPLTMHTFTAFADLAVVFGGLSSEPGEGDDIGPIHEEPFRGRFPRLDVWCLAPDTMYWHRPNISEHPLPCARFGHTMTLIGPETSRSCLLLFGGRGYDGCLSDVWLLHGQTDAQDWRWVPVVANGGDVSRPVPQERHGHVMRRVAGKLVLYGGRNVHGVTLHDVWLATLNEAGVWWRLLQPSGPVPLSRCYPGSCVVASRFLFINGGLHCAGNDDGEPMEDTIPVLLGDCHAFDAVASKWTPSYPSGSCPSPRWQHTLTRIRKKIYLMAGRDDQDLCADLYCLDIRSLTWSLIKVNEMGPQDPRCGHGATVLNHDMFVFGGGTTDQLLNDLHVLNTWIGVKSQEQKWEAMEQVEMGPGMQAVAEAAATMHKVQDADEAEDAALMAAARALSNGTPSVSTNAFMHTLPITPPFGSQLPSIVPPLLPDSPNRAATVASRVSSPHTPSPPLTSSASTSPATGRLPAPHHHTAGLPVAAGPGASTQPLRWDGNPSSPLATLFSRPRSRTASDGKTPPSGGSRRRRRVVKFNTKAIVAYPVSLTSRSIMDTRGFPREVRHPVDARVKLDGDRLDAGRLHDARPAHVAKPIIKRICLHGWLPEEGEFGLAPAEDIFVLCDLMLELLGSRDFETLIDVPAPAKVFGDIHGQFMELMQFFYAYTFPNKYNGDISYVNYVFNGDFVDRGPFSLEVVCLLFSLKIAYPDNVHLIRGNHEDRAINCFNGFQAECESKLGAEQGHAVWDAVNNVFDHLPLAARIGRRVLCMHGGIGRGQWSLADLDRVQLPISDPQSHPLLVDIMWSDPAESDHVLGIHANSRGEGIVQFPKAVVHDFCARNELELLIRSHECVEGGYEFFSDGELVTVFSASNYTGFYGNSGAFLEITQKLVITPKLILGNMYLGQLQEAVADVAQEASDIILDSTAAYPDDDGDDDTEFGGEGYDDGMLVGDDVDVDYDGVDTYGDVDVADEEAAVAALAYGGEAVSAAAAEGMMDEGGDEPAASTAAFGLFPPPHASLLPPPPGQAVHGGHGDGDDDQHNGDGGEDDDVRATQSLPRLD